MKIITLKEIMHYAVPATKKHGLFLTGVYLVFTALMAVAFLLCLALNVPLIYVVYSKIPQYCGFLLENKTPTPADMHLCVTSLLNYTAPYWFLALVSFLFSLFLMILWGTFLATGLIKVVFAIHDHGRHSWRLLFSGAHYLVRQFFAIILYSSMVFAGFLLFIIPGIILAITFALHSFVLIDRDCGILEAFRRSAELTRGVRWKLFGYWLLTGIVSTAISAVRILCSYVTGFPMSMIFNFLETMAQFALFCLVLLALVHIYRLLQDQTDLPVVSGK